MPELRLPRLRFPRLWQGLALAATLAVVYLSLTPNPPRPPGPLSWDKAQHVLAYALLAAAWAQSLSGRHWGGVVIGLLALGTGLEGLQGLGAARMPQLLDVVANTLGVGVGLVLSLPPLGRGLWLLDDALARLLPRH